MNKSIRVMHFADTHFGVEAHGKTDAAGLNTRLVDFKRTLLHAIELALKEKPDAAVFAGDAYKTRDPRQTDQREFADCIRTLAEAGVPVVLLMGNHDMPITQGRASAIDIYQTLRVPNTLVLREPGLHLIETKNGPLRIAALPYLSRAALGTQETAERNIPAVQKMLEKKYCSWLADIAQQLQQQPRLPTLLAGHFWAEGARLSQWQSGYLSDTAEPRVPLEALINPAWDYVALGHIHRHQNLNPGKQPPVVYSGSPDTIDFGEADETKGFVLADIAPGKTKYKFIPLETGRKFIDIVVDADCDDPTERILAEVRSHELRGSIVRLTYSIGESRRSLVRDREVREVLAIASDFSIARRVRKDAAIRNKMLTETISPRQALERYLEAHNGLKNRKEVLMQAAEPLMQRLENEEAEL